MKGKQRTNQQLVVSCISFYSFATVLFFLFSLAAAATATATGASEGVETSDGIDSDHVKGERAPLRKRLEEEDTTTNNHDADDNDNNAAIHIDKTVKLGQRDGTICNPGATKAVEGVVDSFVTYVYVVTNIGETCLNNVVLVDDYLHYTNIFTEGGTQHGGGMIHPGQQFRKCFETTIRHGEGANSTSSTTTLDGRRFVPIQNKYAATVSGTPVDCLRGNKLLLSSGVGYDQSVVSATDVAMATDIGGDYVQDYHHNEEEDETKNRITKMVPTPNNKQSGNYCTTDRQVELLDTGESVITTTETCNNCECTPP